MSWSIPTLIEQDIKNGKAQYRTFQTGNGGQSILPVPPNSYVVIFGYDFSPAGGGFLRRVTVSSSDSAYTEISALFSTQQISFYTGTDFYPFIHHVDLNTIVAPRVTNASAPDAETVETYSLFQEVNNTPLARQVYITSTNDVTITHGLINNSTRASANAIPVTNRTPQGLTYGGSPQVVNTQTNYGPAGTPLQFMQPSPKDYQDFAFGLLPANADGQAFATPDAANGLIDSTDFITGAFGIGITNLAATNYYLCLHYALYTETVPESRG
jgi:hypothetical protein